METACFSKPYFEQPRDVLEAEYELFPESSDPRIEATGVSSWTWMHEGSSVGFKRQREDVSRRSVVILSIRFPFQKLIPNWSPLRLKTRGLVGMRNRTRSRNLRSIYLR
ncbi:hypothetical protein MKX03_032696 [Papaver bracteatum]|nr:hypothetical protein MKX03_031967 [Papaver bracteatum]KAI3867116.1 hypothetical protein MKX03_032696 [Papaver bracteatum]